MQGCDCPACPVIPIKRTSPFPLASIAGIRASPRTQGRVPLHWMLRPWSWIRSSLSVFKRSRERWISSRGFLIGPFTRLGGQEKIFAVPGHPGTDEDLRISVTRSRVDVVHPVLRRFPGPDPHPFGLPVSGPPREDRARAHVAGTAERSFFDQIALSFRILFISGGAQPVPPASE